MIYLDSAATTQPHFFSKDYPMWFNTNTAYSVEANKTLNSCRERIAKCLGVKGGKILFTRCATESIQWLASKMTNVVCDREQHDSLWECRKSIGRGGYLSVGQTVNQLCGKINEFTLDKNKPDMLFYGNDITATIGHAPIDLNGFDCVWWSGHKFGAEKGIGGLWVSDRLAWYLGATEDSRNQYGLIHGTLNLPAVMAMTEAMEDCTARMNYNLIQWDKLKDTMKNAFEVANIPYNIYGDGWNECKTTPAINLVYLPNINADALQQFLATKDIYVGLAASACAGEHDYRVALTLGLREVEARQSIRVSFSVDTTVDDVLALANGIKAYMELFAH